MDAALVQVVRNGAWWLIVGGAVAFVGACWPPYRQWSAPFEEGLRVIAAHPVGWKIIHAGLFTGMWMLVVGSGLLAYALRGGAGGSLALVAAALLGVAAVAWSANIASRLSATVWAANELVRSGSVPASYARWRALASYLFGAFSVLTYLSVACTGAVALQSGLASRFVGWLMVAWGLTGGFVVGFNVPIVAYIPYVVFGVATFRGLG